jgi:glutathione S-transferase
MHVGGLLLSSASTLKGMLFMELVAIVISLALLQYSVFGMLVGKARGTYEIKAPAISGHPIFERDYRVHMNTLEQLTVFIPAILIFGYFGNAAIAAGLGLVFLVGRVMFLIGYVKDPAKRGPGFLIGYIPTVVLLLGGLIYAVQHAF